MKLTPFAKVLHHRRHPRRHRLRGLALQGPRHPQVGDGGDKGRTHAGTSRAARRRLRRPQERAADPVARCRCRPACPRSLNGRQARIGRWWWRSTPGPATRPGIVFNNGMEPEPTRRATSSKYGMDVKFVLLEDPAAKLAAFRKGDVDIMWNTVDNWAREASILAEKNQKAKSIIMQDWSRGGDGIVSLASINSIEELKGTGSPARSSRRRTSCCSICCRSRGSPPRTALRWRRASSSRRTRRPPRPMFKAKQVDAAVTWEPDLSGAVTARGDEAHVLVSTTAATNIIADTLCARQDLIDQAPETVRDFVHGWFDGIDMMKNDPARLVRHRRQGSQARYRHRLRHALRPQAHAVRRQRAVLRPLRRQGALRDAVRHRVRDLAQEGAGHAGGRGEGLGGHALPQRAGRELPGRRRSRSRSWRRRRRRRTTAPSSTSRSRFTSRPAPTRSCRARTSSSTRSATR